MTDEDRTSEPNDEAIILRQRNEELEGELRATRLASEKRLINAELKAEALKSGMIDLDGLKLIEGNDVRIDEIGEVRGAAAVINRLRRNKPWLFTGGNSSSLASPPSPSAGRAKLATEMTLDEWRAARSDLVRRR